MAAEEREPTREELLAMAYADGELRGAEREAFERELATRSELRLLVTRERRLDALARGAAGPEPMDHEWRALAADPLQRAGLGLGWFLLLGGLALGLIATFVALWLSDVDLTWKLALSAVALGFAVLLALAVRARLRTRAYDPYTEIQR